MKALGLLCVACAVAGGCTDEAVRAGPDAAAPDPRDASKDAAEDAEADRFSDDRAEGDATGFDSPSDAMDVELETATDVTHASDAQDAGDGSPPADAMKDAAGPLCDCTLQNAVDRRGVAEVTVAFSCCTFAPKCLRVSAGTRLRFAGNFISHPFSPSRDSDQGGPLLEVSSGGEASFEFSQPGSFGYYCTLHGFDQPLGGMCGAVLVEP